jgi:hypothetical protein
MSADSISAQPSPSGKPRCPRCGAEVFSPTSASCWLCEEKAATGASAAVPTEDFREKFERIQLPQRGGDNPAWSVFGVLAILLTLGLASAGPGILIVLLILAVPAMIRAAVAASRLAAAGKPMGGLAMASAFLSSIGIVALVGLASFAAFYATCFVVCLGGLEAFGKSESSLLVVSVGAGLVPGLLVAVLLFRWLWPRKD